ncbi:tetraacyldisaccharide 4'-kinase [Psittacicella hinzii]|uniref:Tetraacyldisaccharide 4'-kinase n=1 Tax=Psittacicella hinzii TaxID=2028575 RepID=A0A3A1YBJ2_9GAMM|nr:tetraacyldisaccharide 4'-kinase [Psittacicella hinzii]RIY34548.1 tetraacyldisaccharide 4'-kinase [Psittacicella hinzii]
MKFWYKPKVTFTAALLWPLSLLYKKLAYRKYAKDLNSLSAPNSPAQQLQVPVIVVGNITVGGTGKTPMVRFLFRYLREMGFKVGVISRGYGGNYKGVHHVTAEDTALTVGDEVAMQFAYCQRQGLHDVEFVVCRERIQAALKAQELGCNFIISDDGLQHYALPRHLEIAVVGPLALGNKLFIPAGPLREEAKRLRKVDFVINNSDNPDFGVYKMKHAYLGFLPVKAINQVGEVAQNITSVLQNWDNFLQQQAPQSLIIWQEYIKHHPAFIAELETHYAPFTLDTRKEYLTAEFNRPEQVLDLQAAQITPEQLAQQVNLANQANATDANNSSATTNSQSSPTLGELDPDDPQLLAKIEEHVHLLTPEELQKVVHKLGKSESKATEKHSSKLFSHATNASEASVNTEVARGAQLEQEQTVVNSTQQSQEAVQVQASQEQQTPPFEVVGVPVTEQDSILFSTDMATESELSKENVVAKEVSKENVVAKEVSEENVLAKEEEATRDNEVAKENNLAKEKDVVNVSEHLQAHAQVESQAQTQAQTVTQSQQALELESHHNFESAEEFLDYLDSQIPPTVFSSKYLLAKSRSLISSEHILVECMQKVFPKVVALCAIGYPEGFKKTLTDLGFTVEAIFAFPDHYQFKQEDIDKLLKEHPELADLPILVTEKDAIKLASLDLPPMTFFLEREGYFDEHTRWLDSLKDKLVNIYTSGVKYE